MKLASPSPDRPAPHYYLTFELAHLRCAVEFLRVAEVRPLHRARSTLHPPDYAAGTATLDELAAGVFDLRIAFGVPIRLDDETRLIVVRAPRPEAPQARLGLFVDRLGDMEYFPAGEIQPAAGHLVGLGRSLLRGQVDAGASRVLILDVDAVAAHLASCLSGV